jgi:DinB superfamily
MTPEQLLTTTALASWKQVVARLDSAISPLNDEALQKEIAPGRNRIYYLVGHLAAVNDRMFPMLFVGDRLHPELDEPFLADPDRKSPDSISPSALKQALKDVNDKLTEAFEKLQPEEWLQRHNAVSPEEFATQPLRNRLAVLVSRTNHVSFHLGQIILVK